MRKAWLCRDWVVLFPQENVHTSQQKEVYWSARSAITEYHRPGGFNSRNSSQFRRQESKVKVPKNVVSGETSHPGLRRAIFSLCCHMAFSLCAQKESELSCPLLKRNPFLQEGGPALRPSLPFNCLLKGSISKYSLIEGTSAQEFGKGEHNSVHKG